MEWSGWPRGGDFQVYGGFPISIRLNAGGIVRLPGLHLVVAALILAVCPGQARGGAWTQERGKLYARASLNRYLSAEEFDTGGHRVPLPLEGEFTDLNLTGYLEYGVTDGLTAATSFAVKRLRSENLIRVTESRGLGDLELALRARLTAGHAGVLSGQLLAKLPSGYDTDVELPLGNGEPEIDARLQFGRGLWPLLPGYCGLEASYRWRSGTPADEIRYLAEFGSNLGTSYCVRAKLDGTLGLGNHDAIDTSGNPTVRNSADLGVMDLTAGRRFGRHIWVEAGFAPALYGRTTTAGSTLTLALAYTGWPGGEPNRLTTDTPQEEQ